MSDELPVIYRRHLDAAVDDPGALAEVWEPDGVLEFPYAGSVASPFRLEGVPAMVAYFRELTAWSGWDFRDAVVRKIGEEYVIEMHGSADRGDERRYEQDYIVRLGLSTRGRIAWMREFWDPTRFG